MWVREIKQTSVVFVPVRWGSVFGGSGWGRGFSISSGSSLSSSVSSSTTFTRLILYASLSSSPIPHTFDPPLCCSLLRPGARAPSALGWKPNFSSGLILSSIPPFLHSKIQCRLLHCNHTSTIRPKLPTLGLTHDAVVMSLPLLVATLSTHIKPGVFTECVS
ncbi:hypothetical protein EX30DRAFT_248046 [Ascodesmis nigricans]|uniref:Uncharacterized protein n=1 Tax=Ascodesmis nigricans TaxID=341454 RepID=A0A4S2MHR6_9PEZI|nr:hypothetical protein EX30DRAFT_248046 [Ascodesmis nigricans]